MHCESAQEDISVRGHLHNIAVLAAKVHKNANSVTPRCSIACIKRQIYGKLVRRCDHESAY